VPRVEVTPADEPPDLQLRHSVAVQLLADMGFQGATTAPTFNEYIKSLRKLGLPFGRGESRSGVRLAAYSYNHIMELAVVLSLRVYNAVPDAVLIELVRHRPILYDLYAEAWRRRRASGRRRGFTLRSRDGTVRLYCGAYLDLQIVHDGRHLLGFGPPRLVDAVEAVRMFAAAPETGQAIMPVKISAIAESLGERLARGRPKRSIARAKARVSRSDAPPARPATRTRRAARQ
jgi:hypothetical protein